MIKNYKLLFTSLFLFFAGIMNAQINVNIQAKIMGSKAEFSPSVSTNPNISTLVFRWDFGDGSDVYYTNSNEYFTHKYSKVRLYKVELIAIDTSGLLPNDTTHKFINIICIADFKYTISSPKKVTFSDISDMESSTNVNYFWEYSDSNITKQSKDDIHIFPKYRTYNVKHIIIDNTKANTCNDTIEKFIELEPSAPCLAKFKYTIDNQTVSFKNSSTSLYYNNSYTWDFNNGTRTYTSSPSDVKTTYSDTRDYIVTLRVINEEKTCSDTFVDTIRIKCIVDFDYVVSGDSVQFTNISKSAGDFTNPQYSWDFGNGDSSNVENPLYKYPISDSNYFVNFSISNNEGCNGQIKKRVVIGNPLQDIIVTYYKQDTILLPVSSARLYLIQTDYYKRTFSIIDSVDVSNDSVYIFKDINPGNYLIKMALLPTDSDYLKYMPTYYFTNNYWYGYTWMNASVFPHNNLYPSKIPIKLHKIQHDNGDKYFVGYVYDGQTQTKEPLENMNVFLISYKSKYYSATVVDHTKTDVNGKYEFNNLEEKEYRIHVEILGKPSEIHYATPESKSTIFNYYNFDVNKDSIVLSRYPANINSFQNNNFKIYPNPVNDFLNIELEKDTENIDIEIYDISGSLVLKNKINSNEKIDVSNIKTGIYFIQIQTENLTIYRQKFLKD